MYLRPDFSSKIERGEMDYALTLICHRVLSLLWICDPFSCTLCDNVTNTGQYIWVDYRISCVFVTNEHNTWEIFYLWDIFICVSVYMYSLKVAYMMCDIWCKTNYKCKIHVILTITKTSMFRMYTRLLTVKYKNSFRGF